MAVLLVLSLCGAGKSAYDRVHALDIPKTNLNLALNQLAQQTGVQFLFPFDLVKSLEAGPVKGRYSLREALAILLRDSQLTSGLTGSGVITISRNNSILGKGENVNKPITISQKLSAIFLSIFSATGATAATETAAKAVNKNSMEEIVVSARRVEERLQDVPIAITAVTGDNLQRLDIRNATDLQRIVPSLNVTGSISRNDEAMTLRGLRQTGEFKGAGAGPAVVSYFAEVPGRANGPGLYLDLESVQVLKGPQGTLFGRNTTGGAILFQPRKPDAELGGYLQTTFGSFDRRDIEGAINVPVIADKLMIRAAAQQQVRDGFTKDAVSGQEYDNRDNWSARLSILYIPNDFLENYAILWGSEYDENGYGFVFSENNPDGPFATLLNPLFAEQQQRGIRRVALGSDTKEILKSHGIINRTELNFTEQLSLTNILSYSRQKGAKAADLDGTTLPITDSLGPRSGTWNPNDSTLTEELQLQLTALDNALSWRLGGYYEKLDTEGQQTFAQHLSLGFTGVQNDAPYEATSKAIFTHAKFDLGQFWSWADGINVATGYRYTEEESSLMFDLTGYLGIIDPPPVPAPGDACNSVPGAVFPNCLAGDSDKYRGESWDLSIDYSLNDNVMFYASYRRGFKSGGFNPAVGLFFGADSPEFSFGPEKVDAYELGGKITWSAGAVNGASNFAVYTSKYQDVQVLNTLTIDAIQTTATQNAAAATINGFELEGEINILGGLSLTYGYAYTDASYDDYITPSGEDLSGLSFLNTPEHMLNIGINYDYVMPDTLGTLSFSGLYSWQDEMFSGFVNDDFPGAVIEDYELINLRLAWNEIAGSRFNASVFVNNLQDTDYRIANLVRYDVTGQVLALYGEPRMWGVTLGLNF